MPPAVMVAALPGPSNPIVPCEVKRRPELVTIKLLLALEGPMRRMPALEMTPPLRSKELLKAAPLPMVPLLPSQSQYESANTVTVLLEEPTPILIAPPLTSEALVTVMTLKPAD